MSRRRSKFVTRLRRAEPGTQNLEVSDSLLPLVPRLESKRAVRSLPKIFFQLLAQLRAGAEEQAFHRGHSEFEHLGDLLVAHVLVAAHDHGHALRLGKFLDA